MSRFNTGNPLGSNDPRDLDDNAKNMDLAVNSEEAQWVDRLARNRKTFAGMESEFLSDQERREGEFLSDQERREDEFQDSQDDRDDAFDASQASREARFNNFIVSSGYQFVGDYGPGIEITEYNQLVRDSNGEFWRVSGQVDLPYVTTGAGIPEDDALVPAGDAVLRQDLANPDKGASMVAGAVRYVQTIDDLALIKPDSLKDGQSAQVVSTGRAGLFRWQSGDLSAQCAADPLRGIYVPADGDDGSGGAWVREIAGFVTPEMFGAEVAETDNSDQLNAFFSVAVPAKRIDRVFKAAKQVHIPYGARIESLGGGIDFSDSGDLSVFPGGVSLLVGGGSLEDIPGILADIEAGATSVTFAAEHGLSEGDVFLVYNPADYSYSGFRPVYRAGEMLEVSRVDGDTVHLAGAVYAAYTATDVDVYKLPSGDVNFLGDFSVSAPASLNGVTAIRFERVVNSTISGIKASGADMACISFKQCYNVTGAALVCRQTRAGSGSGNYGLSVANCQKMRLSGDFTARRHASTIGGFGDAGSVVNRDIVIEGSFSTMADGSVQAVDSHGNSEFITYRGTANGGVICGGNRTRFEGKIIAPAIGVAIAASELSGFDHDFSGVEIYSDFDPLVYGRGVIDIAGNDANTLDERTVLGGVFNLSGVTVSAPNAERILEVVNRGSNAVDLDIDISGMQVLKKDTSGANVTLRISRVAGEPFRNIKATGYKDRTGGANSLAASAVGAVEGFEQSGVLLIPVTSGSSTASGTLTFPFDIGNKAAVFPAVARAPLSGVFLVATVSNITKSGATIHVSTVDGSNFGANTDIPVSWRAEAY